MDITIKTQIMVDLNYEIWGHELAFINVLMDGSKSDEQLQEQITANADFIMKKVVWIHANKEKFEQAIQPLRQEPVNVYAIESLQFDLTTEPVAVEALVDCKDAFKGLARVQITEDEKVLFMSVR